MDDTAIQDDATPREEIVADPEKAHLEQVEFTTEKVEERVVDADAQGYLDHNVVIDPATNKRLLKLINWRYGTIPYETNSELIRRVR